MCISLKKSYYRVRAEEKYSHVTTQDRIDRKHSELSFVLSAAQTQRTRNYVD